MASKKRKQANFAPRKVGAINDGEFFDDCPICQAQKRAIEEGREITMEELMEAFQVAKDQGHMVGGDWFGRPDSPLRM